MILRLAVLFWLSAGAAALAQATPAEMAAAAVRQMQAATESLQRADGARDRVQALTATILAHESGLEAMRDGLRGISEREAQLSRSLKAREDEISDLLGVLQVMETASPPVLLVHPAGPLGTARSAMLLVGITPALQAGADQLRADLTEVRELRSAREAAVAVLENGLDGVRQARADLGQAIAERTDLPRRFTEDPVRTAILTSSVETLEGFAKDLSKMTEDEIAPMSADVTDLKGKLDLPVQGVVLRRAGEPDAAGIRRGGLVLATRPRALVTTPVAATVRYRGPLLDMGIVMILEPQPDVLFVLSGLDTVFGEAGQVVPAGSPVGLMGGETPEIGAILSTSGDGTGTDRSETLYMEVRESGRPVDPETWFRTEKDG
ncbi:peptidase M23 [Sedimentitalea sp. JM2-8]|uniref:Peptidase M23 n=1 Tax=Sedimentitalea xiamensis TaxID=3050037 RepID=A0ABT7F8Q8_9RHOB|nr:peptidase M23 [Sedimentitalea xiamensis]MDK3071503.1 peptidase M23 [Sedimentitalea xiamensis]